MTERKFIVTEGRTGGELKAQAQQWAEQLGAVYMPRSHSKSLDTVMEELQLEAVLIATRQGPRIYSKAGVFAYHPGMAVLRLQQLKRGASDHLVNALGLQQGMRVLDGTLGLASDAAIASYIVGEQGSVIGVEASPLLHFVVSRGLQTYAAEDTDLTQALRRIKTVQQSSEEYLRQCLADNVSFDVIYFDPMFRRPVQGSVSMDALRPLAYEQPLSKATVELAVKLAPRVV
ncbi:protein-L-IsoD(D-D) O-methyltransferase, partial [gut metagenome]